MRGISNQKIRNEKEEEVEQGGRGGKEEEGKGLRGK